MINLEMDGLTQRVIAEIAGVSAATVSRHIANNKYRPLELGNQKNFRYPVATARQVIEEAANINKNVVKKRQCFYNFKGGVGKTSLCFQVSSHIALMGYDVLVIDADPQGHLSTSCGFQTHESHLTLYDKIINNAKWRDIIKPIFPGYDCVPANLSLTRLEVGINTMPKREERLTMELSEIEDQYDFIFIDTNPTISHLNRNIVNYSDMINIVCETQPYSLNGLKLLTEDLDVFFSHMQLYPKPIHIIPNKYEDRASSSAEAMTVLREFYGKHIKPDFAIRKSEEINTSAKLGKPLAFFTKKNSIAFSDIMELVRYTVETSIQSEEKNNEKH